MGLSIDLDAVDPCDAPGVGSPVPGGIKAGELVDSLARLCRQTRFLGVEIVELDPALDEGGATERLVRDLLAA
ncbi:MAG: Formimidoylglutamase, partial [Alphaproteobacteria bacterium MarineAlpha10_Bin3]